MKNPSNWFNSLLHAIHGIGVASTERNMKFHFIASIGVCITAYLLKLTQIEWALILSAIMLVLITEIINTAIEYLCDFVTQDYSLQIKKIKDLAASAVLLSSLYALFIALLILIPKFL